VSFRKFLTIEHVPRITTVCICIYVFGCRLSLFSLYYYYYYYYWVRSVAYTRLEEVLTGLTPDRQGGSWWPPCYTHKQLTFFHSTVPLLPYSHYIRPVAASVPVRFHCCTDTSHSTLATTGNRSTSCGCNSTNAHAYRQLLCLACYACHPNTKAFSCCKVQQKIHNLRPTSLKLSIIGSNNAKLKPCTVDPHT
jgi:hypothetical protein